MPDINTPPSRIEPSTMNSLVGPARDIFRAAAPWSPQRPDTLVICCSDGRWHKQVEEFIAEHVSDRADLYAVPGGPAGFNLWSSSLAESSVAERALRFLMKHHELESVWLIAHENCAYYRAKYNPLDEQFVCQRQIDDLNRSAASIRNWFPRILVRKVFAQVREGHVEFVTMLDEWS